MSGFEASRWRTKSALSALALATIDIYVTCTYTPAIDPNLPSPTGLFWTARLIRPLTLCILDSVIAFLIYASATNRFLLFSSPSTDSETLHRAQERSLTQTNLSLQFTLQRLHAFSIARNAIVREPALKAGDDEYWRAVIAMQGPPGSGGVWDDEEVKAATARATGDGTVDIERLQREARAYVDSVTKDLERY